ncbi:MAG TPA: AAA family ATPase [Methylomirabilota bacterium]
MREGRGQVVGVVADPGTGKSRLVHEFRRTLASERATYLVGACLPYAQSTPYTPIVDILRSNFQIDDGDNTLQIDEKLRRGALALDPSLQSTLPFLRELLTLQPEESIKALGAAAKRQKTFEAIRALTVAGSRRAPLILVVEDLHWIDQTSEDYLAYVIDSLAALRVLLVTTQRPGYRVRWSDKTYYRQIAVDVLTEAETTILIQSLLDGRAVSEALVRRLHERAEGNPFFVEEIVRSLRERGDALKGTLEFPETAQGIVRARLDRLDERVKRTAQVAAVIGREFGERLLAEVADTPACLSDDLHTLTRGEFVRETRFFPEPEYLFKHAIIQDVAYESILVRRRQQLHRDIGRAIERLYADRLVEYHAVLAHHFAHGNDPRKAVEYLVKAGDKAAAAAAPEAMTLYRRALDFVDADDAKGRADILAKMMPVAYFQLQDGEQSLRLAEEALAIYERLGDRQNIVAVHLHVQTMYAVGYGDGAESRAIDHLLAIERLTDDEPDSVQKGQVYQRIAHLYLHRGVPAKSVEWAGRAVALYERLGSPLGTCLGTALTYTGRVRAGLAYNMRNWEPLLASGNVPIISILAHELTHTLALLRDGPSVVRIGEQALSVLGGGAWLSAMVRRPLLHAYLLSGDMARAAAAADAIAAIEPQTYLG